MTVPHRTSPLAAPSVEGAVELLRRRGLRVSSARRLVIEALYAAERPLTADEIAAGLEGWLPSSDLASVYRNLDTLEELGLVRHFHAGHGAGRYALAAAGDVEFVSCERCGAFASVPAARLDRARALIQRETGYRARFSHFPLVGTCAGCLDPGGRSPCTSLTGFSRTRSRSPVRSRRSRRSATDFAAPRSTSTIAACRCSASPPRSCSRRRCSTSRSPGGTSGHFLGAALAAVLLGPWLASLVLAVVLVAQAFVFADGGITALGANVLNMGVLGGVVVGGLMLAARRALPNTRATLLGVAAGGAWLAIMVGAAGCAIELAVSGTVPLATVLPAMLGVHAVIGAGEAVITVAAVSAVLATRPDLIHGPVPEPASPVLPNPALS